jgi:hypothetical protein
VSVFIRKSLKTKDLKSTRFRSLLFSSQESKKFIFPRLFWPVLALVFALLYEMDGLKGPGGNRGFDRVATLGVGWACGPRVILKHGQRKYVPPPPSAVKLET